MTTMATATLIHTTIMVIRIPITMDRDYQLTHHFSGLTFRNKKLVIDPPL